MQIRTRLTLQFLLLGGLIMIIASIAIYITSSNLRRNDFFKLLQNKARTTMNLLSNIPMVDADHILEIEKKNPSSLKNERIVIINYTNNRIVYTSDDKRELTITKEILERIHTGYMLTFYQPPFEGIATMYVNNHGSFIVVAAATDTEGTQRQKNLLITLVSVCLVSLALFFIAGWFYSGRALKPISDVVREVEEISISSLNHRVSEGNGTDEIGRLAGTFNNMLERLETSFSMQKDFIANASHELRTPLTAINGQLEVLLLKDRQKEEYKAALCSVLEDIRSLIDLSNRLLLMARARSETPLRNIKKIRIDEILWQAREETIRHNPRYGVNIYLDGSLTDSDQMIIEGDEYMIKVALLNIIENACKYSPDRNVDIKFEFPGRSVNIIFKDNGIGIAAEDITKIFEPFYRGSNTMTYPGTGIGLALANQIIRSHNGSINLTSEINKGTTVIITLPHPVNG